MKALKSILVGVSMLLAGTAAEADPIRFAVAAEPYPPFATKGPDGTWHGFEVDLINRLCARIKAECRIQEVAWDGIVPALLSKRIDVIFASMSITPEREKEIAFTKPYYETPVLVAGPEAAAFDLSPRAMKGKSIGVQISTVSASYVKQRYDGIVEIRYYDTQDSANADLAAGRIDLMMADAVGINDFVKTDEAKTAGIVVKGTVPYDPIFGSGIGAGLRKADTALKDRLNAAITAELDSPEYGTLSQSYFGANLKPTR